MEALFLELLTSFVRGRKTEYNGSLLKSEDWNRLLTLSVYHQVIPIVYESVCRADWFHKELPAVAGMWKRETRMAVARQTMMTEGFLRLYQEMEKENLRPLVLKGIICRSLYPKPDYRMSADEDLLVAKEDFWKLDHFLLKRGFVRDESKELLKGKMKTLHEVGYRNRLSGLYLEVHVSLFPEESGAYGHFNRMFKGVFQKAEAVSIKDCSIWTLHPTDHFLFLLCHNAKHFMHSGFGIRQVFDMMLFAECYGEQIDWKIVFEKAKRYKLYVFLMHLFDIGVRYMEFDPGKACWPKEKPMPKGNLDSDDLLKDILVGGVFGGSSKDRVHSSNITLAAVNKKKGLGSIAAALFPNRSYMEKRYAYVRKMPWLLPLGWLHRLLDYVKKNKGTGGKKVIKTANARVAVLKKYGLL